MSLKENHKAAEQAIRAVRGLLLAEWSSVVSQRLCVFETWSVPSAGLLVVQRLYAGPTAQYKLQHFEVLKPMGADNKMDTLIAEIQAYAIGADKPLDAQAQALVEEIVDRPDVPRGLAARLVSEGLSDNSSVYNVELFYEHESTNRIVLHCVDEKSGRDMIDSLERCTVDAPRLIDAT